MLAIELKKHPTNYSLQERISNFELTKSDAKKNLRKIFNEKTNKKTLPYTDWLSEVDEAWLYARARCSQIPCRGSSRGSRPGYAGWR